MIHRFVGNSVQSTVAVETLDALYEQLADMASLATWRSDSILASWNVAQWQQYVQTQMGILKSWSVRLRDLQQKGRTSFLREAPCSLYSEMLMVTMFTRIWHGILVLESESQEELKSCLSEIEYLQLRMCQFEHHFLDTLQQMEWSNEEMQTFNELYQLVNRWGEQALSVLGNSVSNDSRQSALGRMLFVSSRIPNVSVPFVIPVDHDVLELLSRFERASKPRTTLISGLSRSVARLLG